VAVGYGVAMTILRTDLVPGSEAPLPAVTLRSLLGEPTLRLRAIHVPDTHLDREVRWVTVTELVDPSSLIGDELILTLGSAWPDPDSPDIDRFIGRLSRAGVAAVGIALGFEHDEIPPRMMAAARELGLPLIEVLRGTSFRKIGEHVVSQIARGRYMAVQQNVDSYEELTGALLTRLGFEGLLDTLARKIGTPIVVLDYHGNVIASRPEREPWAVAGIVAARPDLVHGTVVDGLEVFPITFNDHVIAFLCTKGRPAPNAETTIKFAIGLIAVELSRRQAEVRGRRELLGQVLRDYVQGELLDHEAERRLRRAGLGFDGANRVMLARVEWNGGHTDLPWDGDMFLRERAGTYLVAQVDDLIAVVCPDSIPVDELARSTAAYLQQLGTATIGYGGAHRGITGLRHSWLEAQDALRHGGEPDSSRSMNMSRIVLANMKVPLRHIGEEALRPLIDHDRENDAQLVDTLAAFLSNDRQMNATARELKVHRNTLRYRLQLIERLTSRDFASFQDLVDLHLSLRAVEHGAAPERTGRMRPS